VSGTLRPRIVVLQGDRILTARELPPDQEWHLGRRPDSPLPLQERSISRHHARLYCDGAGAHLEDLGTPNGTWVDGLPLRGTLLLRDGQVIRLGQSTNPEPILMRFEDPAARLLAALGTAPSAPSAPSTTAFAAAETAASVPGEAGSALVRESSLAQLSEPLPGELRLPAAAPLDGGPPQEASAAGAEAEPGRREPPRAAAAFLGLGPRALVGASLAFIAVFWLLWALKSTQKPWHSVRVEPLRAQPGERISIRGAEVEPSDSLKAFFDARQAEVEQATLGQLVIVVPELPALDAGTRTVELRVERRGIVVLKQGLQYETLPRIERIEPVAAAVADTVALIGGGFVADPTRVRVRIGGREASVLAAEPQRLLVRVPVVARSAPVEAPVEVEIEGLTSREARLQVRPREAACVALTWSARAVAPRVFEVSHDFGPALLVDGSVRAGAPPDELPASARRAIETLQAAFQAPPTAALRFEVDERGRAPALVASGPGSSRRIVAALGPAVKELLRERLPELRQPELILYWQAAVLNDLHALIVRQQPPRVLPESDAVAALLRRLHQLSLDTGGSGCPAAAEIETLSPDERRDLAAVALRLPPRFGDVAGVWEGSFENLAGDGPSRAGLEMQLELEQTGTRLKGRLFLFEVRGPGIRWSPPPLSGLEGRLRLTAGTEVDLRLPPVPPHEITRLTGVVADDLMSGSYRTSRGASGAFRLTYKAR
jgi:hypothetical protein